MHPFCAITSAVLLSGAALAKEPEVPPEVAEPLHGTWVIDVGASDDSRTALRQLVDARIGELAGGRPPGGGGMGGPPGGGMGGSPGGGMGGPPGGGMGGPPGGGMGGPPGGGGGPPGGGPAGSGGGGATEMRTLMDSMGVVESLLRSTSELTLALEGNTLIVTWKDWKPVVLDVGGGAVKVDASNVEPQVGAEADGKLRVRALWHPGTSEASEVELQRRVGKIRLYEHVLVPDRGSASAPNQLVVVVELHLPGDVPALWLRQVYRSEPPPGSG